MKSINDNQSIISNMDNMPEMSEISVYVNSVLWDELIEFIESTYNVMPQREYSRCSEAPGWNIKYRKSGRSICTLYPQKNKFECLITIGRKESAEMEFVLPLCCDYIQKLYANAGGLNGAKWLMCEVKDREIFENVKNLILLRTKPKTDK